MNGLRALWLGLLIVSFASGAQARLGETRAEIAKRYGPPVTEKGSVGEGYIIHSGPNGWGPVHRKNGLLIVVSYVNGVAGRIAIINPKGFSWNEVTLLMEANRQGGTWLLVRDETEDVSGSSHRSWSYRRSTDEAEFHTSMFKRTIENVVLMTPAYHAQREVDRKKADALREANRQKEEDAKKAQEAARLKGF